MREAAAGSRRLQRRAFRLGQDKRPHPLRAAQHPCFIDSLHAIRRGMGDRLSRHILQQPMRRHRNRGTARLDEHRMIALGPRNTFAGAGLRRKRGLRDAVHRLGEAEEGIRCGPFGIPNAVDIDV